MIEFWLGAAAIIAVVLILLVPPLLVRRPAPDAAGRTRDANVSIHRERLAALEAEHQAQPMLASEYAAARLDIERALLADAGDVACAPEPMPSRRMLPLLTAAVLTAAIPLAGVGIYGRLGTPEAIDPPRTEAGLPDVEAMVAGLATRLADEPENLDGWLMLGRSYMVLERPADAADAFARAHALAGDDPALLVDYAEAEALAAGNRFETATRARLDRALALDPDQPKGLWLGGFAALQGGDLDQALARWQHLRRALADDSEEAQVLDTLMARAAAAPSADTAGSAPRAGAAELAVTVSLPADRIGASGILYVFARAVDQAGPPLAVERIESPRFPVRVVLDDGDAMMPGHHLSAFTDVAVSARLSASGDPIARPGDIEARAITATVADAPVVDLVLDRVVP